MKRKVLVLIIMIFTGINSFAEWTDFRDVNRKNTNNYNTNNSIDENMNDYNYENIYDYESSQSNYDYNNGWIQYFKENYFIATTDMDEKLKMKYDEGMRAIYVDETSGVVTSVSEDGSLNYFLISDFSENEYYNVLENNWNYDDCITDYSGLECLNIIYKKSYDNNGDFFEVKLKFQNFEIPGEIRAYENGKALISGIYSDYFPDSKYVNTVDELLDYIKEHDQIPW